MAFNASEEEIRRMFNMYEEMVNEIMKRTNLLVNATKEWAVRIRYKPGIDMASDMVTFYNTELKMSIHRAMELWADSDSSFESFMKRKYAGESAINRGKLMQSQILEMVDNWPPASGDELKHIDTTNPVVGSKDLEELSELIAEYSKDLSDIYSGFQTKVTNEQDDNTLYTSIEPVVHSTYKVLTDGFRQVKNAENHLAQEFEESERNIRSGATEASKNLGKKVMANSRAGFEDMRKRTKALIE